MHLLNVDTLKLETFYNAQVPKYAILSHTWGMEEATFADIQNPESPKTTSLAGFEKIRKTCQQAKIDHYQYVWIDTCCIDKSSSAELTEAINSMFRWYHGSDTCYVYLSDVLKAEFLETFPRSRWFSRGWTLQELLAPDHVVFYDRDWHSLGTKGVHADMVSDITGIDIGALRKQPKGFPKATMGRFCVAKRMSWASGRETTRVEDIAYCLLGIFNINMPLLYGEGERAFIRLQEEIIKSHDDDSILAWDLDTETWDPLGLLPRTVIESMDGGAFRSNVLASSPKDFKDCQNLEYTERSKTPYTITNLGLQIELPLVAVYSPKKDDKYHSAHKVQGWVGLLSCSTGTASKFLGIVLCPAGPEGNFPAEVERIAYGYPSFRHTVLVGPRAAAQAKRSKITIVQQNESGTIRNYSSGFGYFIINESQAVLDAGYHVSHAGAKNVQGRPRRIYNRGTWDPAAKVLTIGGKDMRRDLLRFDFKHDFSDIGFSVYVRGSNAIVHSGSSFSDEEERGFYQLLGETHPNNKIQDMILQSNNKNGRTIRVTIKQNDLFFCRTCEVNVDLTPPVVEDEMR